jgi:DNA-binding LacI/PurR family transcriptional regulator
MRNSEAAKAATKHLLGLDRQRLVAFGAHPGEETGSAALRLTGYREALTDAKITVDEDLIVPVQAWHRHDGATAMREFISRGIEFDGVVAFNDTIAFGALRALQEFGMRVPEDVAVIGFDDIDETQYSMPTLTSIHPGRDDIARIAVDLLARRIRERGRSFDPLEITVPFQLVERESTR